MHACNSISEMDRFEKFRKLKSSLLGPQLGSNDIIADSRRELALYKKAVACLAKTAGSFEKSTHEVSSVHSKLVKQLEERKDTPKCEELVKALVRYKKAFAEVDLSNLKRELSKVETGLRLVTELIERRDAALSEMEHYEAKVSTLAKCSDGEKISRNNAKLSQTTSAFTDLDNKATLELRSVLSQKVETLKKLSTMYVSAYTKVSVDLQDAFARIRTAPERPHVLPTLSPSAPVLDD